MPIADVQAKPFSNRFKLEEFDGKTSKEERLSGVDLGRILACIFVIIIHQKSSHYGGQENLYGGLNQVSRWAVPFYFIMAGYFIPNDRGWFNITLKYFARLFPVYLFWVLIYNINTGNLHIYLEEPDKIIRMLISGGNGYHLWFLPSLGICLFIAAFFVHYTSIWILFSVSVALFIFGLMFGSYATLSLGLQYSEANFSFNTRSGPFFGLIFVSLGIFMRRYFSKFSIKISFALVGFGAVLSSAEIIILNIYYGVPITRHDFLLGTLPLGLGTAMIFLCIKIMNKSFSRVVRALGSISLGIYAIHFMVLTQVTELIHPSSFTDGITVVVIVFLISATVAMLGSKVPIIKKVFC